MLWLSKSWNCSYSLWLNAACQYCWSMVSWESETTIVMHTEKVLRTRWSITWWTAAFQLARWNLWQLTGSSGVQSVPLESKPSSISTTETMMQNIQSARTVTRKCQLRPASHAAIVIILVVQESNCTITHGLTATATDTVRSIIFVKDNATIN